MFGDTFVIEISVFCVVEVVAIMFVAGSVFMVETLVVAVASSILVVVVNSMMPNSGIKFISSEGVFLASFVVISFIAMDVVVGVVEVLFEVPGLFVEVVVDVVAIVFVELEIEGLVDTDAIVVVLGVSVVTVTVPVDVVSSLTKVGSVMVGSVMMGSVMVGSVMVGSVISIRFIGRFPGFDMIFVFSRFITAFSAGLIKFVSVNNSSVGFDSPDINVITVLDTGFIIVDEEELLGVAVGAVTDCSVMVKVT